MKQWQFLLLCNFLYTPAAAYSPGVDRKRAYRSALFGSSSQRPTQKTPYVSDEMPQFSAWDRFKDAIYVSVDAISAIASSTTPREQQDANTIMDSYRDLQESVLSQSGQLSPGQKLVQEYKNRPFFITAAENNKSIFESIKENVYHTAELWTSAQNNKERVTTPSSRLINHSAPVVQARLASNKEIQSLLPKLKDNNPVQRFVAEWKIKNIERQEKERIARIQREEQRRLVKEDILKVGDTLQNTVQGIAKIPSQLSEVAGKTARFLASLPTNIQRTIEQILGIPEQIQRQVDQAQMGVNQSIETTKIVIQDIQSIPQKVQESVEKTQERMVKTRESVEEFTFNTKVMLGMEKPIPRPPKTPPRPPKTPEESAKEMSIQVVKVVGTGTLKVAWWAAKGVAFLTWRGAQIAFSKSYEALEQQAKEARLTKLPTKTGKPTQETTKKISKEATLTQETPPKPRVNFNVVTTPETNVTPIIQEKHAVSVSEKDKAVNEELEREVVEALRLAEEALNFYNKK